MIMHPPDQPHLRRLWKYVSKLSAVLASTAMLGPSLVFLVTPLEARTRKGEKLLAESRIAERDKDWDKALDLSSQALALDPTDAAYQLEARRIRFEAASFHLDAGGRLREAGRLGDALMEYEKAFQIDPALDIAEQEVRRTKSMIDREKRKTDSGGTSSPEEAALTPTQQARKENDARIASMMPMPELKPLNSQPITLLMNNQKPRVLFDTVGKLAGVNVLFDPEFEQGGISRNTSIDLTGATLEQALDYLAILTKSFWKPLSPNAIFVTQDNPTKRRDYEDQVVKVFYLSNVTQPQELQELITTLRQVVEATKLFSYSSQTAIIVRAEADRMALVEKIIADLDKPKAEVMVDVVVMEVNSIRSRQLAAAFAPTGITTNLNFTPRSSLTQNSTTSSTAAGSTTPTTSTTSLLPFNSLGKINFSDYSVTGVPGGLIQAIMSDSGTRILQRPQLRAIDNGKASLKIGDRIPTATGSFQPGIGGVGINPLVNTQFTYIDTGVNLEITPKVHDNGEVSLHMDIDISKVNNTVNIGGIDQPVIGQRKATLDVRLRDGEANMIGGLMSVQDTKTVGGVPGLANIPILGRLFTTDSTTNNKTELLITLIPHIVRGPDTTEANLRTVYSGTGTNYKVMYAPRKTVAPAAAATPAVPVATAVPAVTAPAVEPAVPALPPVVSFAPSQVEASLGTAFTITLQVDNAADLAAIEAHLKYDPAVVRMNNAIAADMLQRGGTQLTPARNIQEASGDATVTLSRPPNSTGVSGSGGLVTITFLALAKGQTTVSLPRVAMRSAGGVSVEATGQPVTIVVK